MNLLLSLIVAAIVGGVACLIMPGRQNMAWWQTLLLGIIGCALANGLVWLLTGEPNGGLIGGILGALLVLFGWGWLRARNIVTIATAAAVLSLSGCVSPDPTPNVAETAIAGKAAGTPVVFTLGVVTWPIGIVGAVGATTQGQYSELPIFIGWPFVWTYVYWITE